ncbi:MAG: YqaJ viral recombinase family protein [Nitrospirae bacterium]|nr:YqaJ viral recombinase family protein [Nitrospirota bacterium]
MVNSNCAGKAGENQNRHYTIVKLRQGTREWHEWRRQGIGASDAPTVMGENPWKSPEYLLREKRGEITFGLNAAMVRGIALEPIARKRYEDKLGFRVEPACLQSIKHEWLRASVDGLATDKGTIVEIKCGKSVYRQASQTRKVPSYYYGQLQHMLAITNFQSIDFFCYWPDHPEVHLNIARDDNYIKRLLDAEYKFWQKI